MMVRCGACRTSFDVQGPGRHRCPACGATNQVGGSPAGAPPPGPAAEPPNSPLAAGAEQSAPPPPPIDLSRVECSECSFGFIVGEVEVAVCPNCGAEVRAGAGGEATE